MLNIFKGIHTGPLPPLTPQEIELSANLRGRVDVLASLIGNRNLLSSPKNLQLAADSIDADLRKLGYTPDAQPYRVGSHIVRNIDAELPGEGNPDEIVLIGAHYDSIYIPGGCPGANDNASGDA